SHYNAPAHSSPFAPYVDAPKPHSQSAPTIPLAHILPSQSSAVAQIPTPPAAHLFSSSSQIHGTTTHSTLPRSTLRQLLRFVLLLHFLELDLCNHLIFV